MCSSILVQNTASDSKRVQQSTSSADSLFNFPKGLSFRRFAKPPSWSLVILVLQETPGRKHCLAASTRGFGQKLDNLSRQYAFVLNSINRSAILLVAPNFMPSNMAVSACKTAPFLESTLSPWEADEQWILLLECICLQLLMVVSQCPCTRPFLQNTQQKWKAGWGGGQTVF